VIVVFALLAAAAVGGFALSQYSCRCAKATGILCARFQSKLSEINATAMRLEQARTNEREQIETGTAVRTPSALARKRDRERGGRSLPAVVPGARLECTERSAVRVTVCATVPASATVKEVQLYVRAEDSKQPWQEAGCRPGRMRGQARFAEKLTERPTATPSRSARDSQTGAAKKSRIARIVVKYAL